MGLNALRAYGHPYGAPILKNHIYDVTTFLPGAHLKLVAPHMVLVQLVIPDELPCFDLTQIRMRILQFYKGLFESISLLFA